MLKTPTAKPRTDPGKIDQSNKRLPDCQLFKKTAYQPAFYPVNRLE